ncbi:MAG: hypothetical protein Q9227_006334 [Pyrenula ochraceoflavens]
MTSKTHGLSPPQIETLAGFSAGVISTLVAHPLDILKTRLQLSPSRNTRLLPTFHLVRTIFRTEGGFPVAFYRGLTPNLVGNSLGWALYFLWYRQLQDLVIQHRYHGSRNAQLTGGDYLLTSLSAGLLSAILTNPIWVIKTRMLSTSANHPGAYRSMLAGLRAIAREEGFGGYFRGLLPALVGVSNSAVYFVAYEKLKSLRIRQKFNHTTNITSPGRATPASGSNPLTNTDYLGISGLSKILAGTLTYPHQVVRARLQAYQHDPKSSTGSSNAYRGVTEVIRRIWQHEGLTGYYKGLGPNLFRVVPSTCVTFLVYENSKWFLSSYHSSSRVGG